MMLRRAIFLILLFFPLTSFGANFTFSPSSGAYKIGQSFSVSLYVSSPSEAINAFSGKINFPSSYLNVSSVSISSSIVNFWTVSPKVDGSTVVFEGLVVNPGYQGSSGKILTINFSPKASAVANLSITGAAILANDGLGSNVLSGTLPTASFTIGEGVPVATTPAGSSSSPLPPIISSSTHPNPFAWYQSGDVAISWGIDDTITGVSYSIDKNPVGDPGTSSKGLVTNYSKTDLTDGEWYAHVRLRNSSGWGDISHFRIGVDTTPPNAVSVIEKPGYQDSTLHAFIEASDDTSGVDYYTISIGGSEPFVWKKEGEEDYISPVVSPGKKLVFVQAVDKAGNYSSNGAYVTIEKVPLPTVDKYTQEIPSTGEFFISGSGVPGSFVYIEAVSQSGGLFNSFLARPKRSGEDLLLKVEVSETGRFSLNTSVNWASGKYTLRVKTVLENGAESSYLPEISVEVLAGKFVMFVRSIIKYLIPLIPLLIVIIIIGFLFVILLRSFQKYRTLIFREAKEAEKKNEEKFDALGERVDTELEVASRSNSLDGKREKEFLEDFQEDLDQAEVEIGNEIGDIENKI